MPRPCKPVSSRLKASASPAPIPASRPPVYPATVRPWRPCAASRVRPVSGSTAPPVRHHRRKRGVNARRCVRPRRTDSRPSRRAAPLQARFKPSESVRQSRADSGKPSAALVAPPDSGEHRNAATIGKPSAVRPCAACQRFRQTSNAPQPFRKIKLKYKPFRSRHRFRNRSRHTERNGNGTVYILNE